MFDAEKAIKNHIDKSKTINTVKNFYNVVFNEPRGKDEEFFLQNWELDLAKSITYEFGDSSASSLANAIYAVTSTQ